MAVSAARKPAKRAAPSVATNTKLAPDCCTSVSYTHLDVYKRQTPKMATR